MCTPVVITYHMILGLWTRFHPTRGPYYPYSLELGRPYLWEFTMGWPSCGKNISYPWLFLAYSNGFVSYSGKIISRFEHIHCILMFSENTVHTFLAMIEFLMFLVRFHRKNYFFHVTLDVFRVTLGVLWISLLRNSFLALTTFTATLCSPRI